LPDLGVRLITESKGTAVQHQIIWLAPNFLHWICIRCTQLCKLLHAPVSCHISWRVFRVGTPWTIKYASVIIVHEHNLQAGRKQISSFKYQAAGIVNNPCKNKFTILKVIQMWWAYLTIDHSSPK
jgi:hypothetical protein